MSRTKQQQISQKNYHRTLKGRFAVSKALAKFKNHIWNLTFEEYEKILKSSNMLCSYCSGSLNETGRGLDRIDNSKGYSVDNVVSCCKECNRLKGEVYSSQELRVMLKALNEFRKGL